jgi:choline dehydrogenase-like flavoprotein
MKRAIVVGSGAGGATVAKELAGQFDVTVLESGGGFRPLSTGLPALEWMKKSRLLFDPRQIQTFFPAVRVRKTGGMFVVTGAGLGGSTTVSAASALRADRDLKALGIDLDREFEEAAREIPVTTDHSARWLPSTRRLFEICRELGLDPQPTPKTIDAERCRMCGRCLLGCIRGAKWDSRRFLDAARRGGARVLTGCHVQRVELKNGRATGVHTRCGLVGRFIAADLVVLAAGGTGTPAILEKSGIAAERTLFVDPIVCLGAEWPDALQCHEIPMPFVVERPGYLLSPYFDLFSFLFNRTWRSAARHTISLMINLAGDSARVSATGIDKGVIEPGGQTLDDALALCREVLDRLGAKTALAGTLHAVHPGGGLPLTSPDVHPERLPDNVWVADSSLLPRAPGGPEILTIVALAKRVARTILAREDVPSPAVAVG